MSPPHSRGRRIEPDERTWPIEGQAAFGAVSAPPAAQSSSRGVRQFRGGKVAHSASLAPRGCRVSCRACQFCRKLAENWHGAFPQVRGSS